MADSSDQIVGLLRDVLRAQEVMREEISELKTAVAVDVAVSAQHRDMSEACFEAIETTLSKEIKPQTEEWKRMKTIGLGFAGVPALGGISFGTMLADRRTVWSFQEAMSMLARPGETIHDIRLRMRCQRCGAVAPYGPVPLRIRWRSRSG